MPTITTRDGAETFYKDWGSVIHVDDDQVVPYEVGGRASAALVEGARLITYEGAPHGITDTHKDRLSSDLLGFVSSLAPSRELAGAASGKE